MGSCCSMSDTDSEKKSDNEEYYRDDFLLRHVLRVPRGACYGDYKCHVCGRYWSSTLSWNNYSQQCRNCQTDVEPNYQRSLCASDMQRSKGTSAEHSMDLCKKCQELGYFCGNYDKRIKQRQRRDRGRYYV